MPATPAVITAPKAPTTPVGWKPALWRCGVVTLPRRAATSIPATYDAIRCWPEMSHSDPTAMATGSMEAAP